MDLQDRGEFLNFAGAVLAGLALSAVGLSWLQGIDLSQRLIWSWSGIVWGLIGVIPLAVLFAIVYRLPWTPARTVREFLQKELAPSLAILTWFDLILLAALTGVAEELFFRGWLEPAVAVTWVWFVTGIGVAPPSSLALLRLSRIVGSILFGLAHIVTLSYAVVAGLVGLYLSWLQTVVEPNSLLVPMVTHGVYDYFGFVMMVYLHRRDQQSSS